MTTVTIINRPTTVTVTNSPTSVAIRAAAPVQVHIAKRGVQGPPGPGDSSNIDPDLLSIYTIAKET